MHLKKCFIFYPAQFCECHNSSDCQWCKDWQECAKAPVEMSIVEECESCCKISEDVKCDESNIECEKDYELTNVIPLSRVQSENWKTD